MQYAGLGAWLDYPNTRDFSALRVNSSTPMETTYDLPQGASARAARRRPFVHRHHPAAAGYSDQTLNQGGCRACSMIRAHTLGTPTPSFEVTRIPTFLLFLKTCGIFLLLPREDAQPVRITHVKPRALGTYLSS